MIPESEWVWCGLPGHFIASNSCRLHLHTRVGDYRISTVGDYHPVDLDDPTYRPTKKMQTIGSGDDAFFETFVFPVSGDGEHGEGEVTDWGEIDSDRYATAVEAEKGHMEFCRKYAAGSWEE